MNIVHFSPACAGLLAWVGGCATTDARTLPTGCTGQTLWSPWLGEETRRGAGALAERLRAAGATLPEAAETDLREGLRWEYVRVLLLAGNDNLGEIEIAGARDATGAPLRLYRSGITASPEQPGSCFRSLLDERGVKHVLNLYEGPMPVEDLTARERTAAAEAGATYDVLAEDGPSGARQFRERLREHPGDPETRAAVGREVARFLNARVLRPGGHPPAGPVHLHCGGGMHRTGMLVGILRRCLGGASRPEIEAEMKAHSAYQSPERPGGFEFDNLEFVMGFECALLEPAR